MTKTVTNREDWDAELQKIIKQSSGHERLRRFDIEHSLTCMFYTSKHRFACSCKPHRVLKDFGAGKVLLRWPQGPPFDRDEDTGNTVVVRF